MAHKAETKFERQERRKRKRSRARQTEYSHEYTLNGIDRIKVLHPTKGFRDRNIDCAAGVIRFPGLRQGVHRLGWDARPMVAAQQFYGRQ